MKINFRNLLILLLIFGLMVAFVMHRIYDKKIDRLKGENAISLMKIENFKKQIVRLENEKGQIVSEKEAIVTKSKNEINAIAKEYFALKKSLEKKIKQTTAVVNVEQDVSADKIEIFYDTILVYKAETLQINDTANYIQVPKSFDYIKENLRLSGSVHKEKIIVDSLQLKNEISFRISETKKTTIVQAVNSNPYFSNQNINSLILKKKTNRWNKWIKPALVGVAVGGGVYYLTK